MKKTAIIFLLGLLAAACTSDKELEPNAALNDQIFEEATSTQNLDKCEEISYQSTKIECIGIVKRSLMTEEELRATVDEVIAIEARATEEMNVDICDEMKEWESQRFACRYNVLANLAIKENNPSLCSDIGDDFYIKECESLF